MSELIFSDIKKKYNMTDEQLYAWASKSLGISKEDVVFQMAIESGEIDGDIVVLQINQEKRLT